MKDKIMQWSKETFKASKKIEIEERTIKTWVDGKPDSVHTAITVIVHNISKKTVIDFAKLPMFPRTSRIDEETSRFTFYL